MKFFSTFFDNTARGLVTGLGVSLSAIIVRKIVDSTIDFCIESDLSLLLGVSYLGMFIGTINEVSRGVQIEPLPQPKIAQT